MTAPLDTSNAGSEHYDYVKAYTDLRKWAATVHGLHTKKGRDNRTLPRLPRQDAARLLKWWEYVTLDLGVAEVAAEAFHGLAGMRAATFRDRGTLPKNRMVQTAIFLHPSNLADDPRVKRFTADEFAHPLTYDEADFYWAGMHETAASIGAAKRIPTLFDQGALLLETVKEEAQQRVADLADVGSGLADVSSKLITAAKYAALAVGGVIAWQALRP